MRGAQPADDHGQKRRAVRTGHVPDLVTSIAGGPEQVGLALVGAGQLATVTDAHHLCATGLALTGLARDMGEVFRLLRVGDIDDRCPIILLLTSKWIDGAAAVMTDVGDPAIALSAD